MKILQVSVGILYLSIFAVLLASVKFSVFSCGNSKCHSASSLQSMMFGTSIVISFTVGLSLSFEIVANWFLDGLSRRRTRKVSVLVLLVMFLDIVQVAGEFLARIFFSSTRAGYNATADSI